jgi:hypothetical protein
VNTGRNIKEKPKKVLRDMEETWNERYRERQEQNRRRKNLIERTYKHRKKHA